MLRWTSSRPTSGRSVSTTATDLAYLLTSSTSGLMGSPGATRAPLNVVIESSYDDRNSCRFLES